jgi:CheY-like chemotaxis protein
VLVVDDNAINRKVLTIPLRKHGIHVIEAENGLTAVEAYARVRPPLVLMDISMPLMDGFEATRQIRQFEIASALQHNRPLASAKARIIAATTHSADRDYQQGKDAGMDDWMLKPIRPSLLVKDILAYKRLYESS